MEEGGRRKGEGEGGREEEGGGGRRREDGVRSQVVEEVEVENLSRKVEPKGESSFA